MDLVPRNTTAEGLHMNWSGWTVFCHLTAHLGCDLPSLSGSNDGDYLTAAECKDIAKRVAKAVASEGEDRIIVVSVPDNLFQSGFRELLLPAHVLETAFGDSLDEVQVKELGDDDIEWLAEWVWFFSRCGGCWQC